MSKGKKKAFGAMLFSLGLIFTLSSGCYASTSWSYDATSGWFTFIDSDGGKINLGITNNVVFPNLPYSMSYSISDSGAYDGSHTLGPGSAGINLGSLDSGFKISFSILTGSDTLTLLDGDGIFLPAGPGNLMIIWGQSGIVTDLSTVMSSSAVPIPPSALLLGSGMLGLLGFGFRRQRSID